MAVVIGLELLARRMRMPPAAAFILGGIALALIPDVPDIALDPDLALVLFLPPLLLSSAFYTVWRDFRANLRTSYSWPSAQSHSRPYVSGSWRTG
jgi:monovalent cation/hydrogen antiporter